MRIYLDSNATTPVRPEVREAILPYLGEAFGNPSSLHWAGAQARRAVEDARDRVAALLGADAREVVFTSGGTEADVLALRGVLTASRRPHPHVITTVVEHSAVLETVQELESSGVRVTRLNVDAEGRLDLEELKAALTEGTLLVSIMTANNETGVLYPVEEAARLAHAAGALFHTDAVQAAGKMPLDTRTSGFDLLSISAHKFGGPKGVGALYVRRGLRLTPVFRGGHQERNRRGGTENVPGIVGIGQAALIAHAESRDPQETDRRGRLGDRLLEGILSRVPETRLNGSRSARLRSTVNVSFLDCEGEAILIGLDNLGIAVSTGSACQAGATEPSHVIKALGLPPAWSLGAVRFSIGHETTEAEIDRVLEVLPGVVERIRSLKGASPRAAAS